MHAVTCNFFNQASQTGAPTPQRPRAATSAGGADEVVRWDSCRLDFFGTFLVKQKSTEKVRGFTGHEHYPQFKIINMNGRLYDPIICRFFSPDNFVQAPEETQSFNRYSYCLNNPLKYIDPSGQIIVIANKEDQKFINQLINKDHKNYSKNFHDLYQKLDKSDIEYSFESWKYDASRKDDGLFSFDAVKNRAIINFTTEDISQMYDPYSGASRFRALFEEIFHAAMFDKTGILDNSCVSEAMAWKFSATAPDTKYSFADTKTGNIYNTLMGRLINSSIATLAMGFKFGMQSTNAYPGIEPENQGKYRDFILGTKDEIKTFFPFFEKFLK